MFGGSRKNSRKTVEIDEEKVKKLIPRLKASGTGLAVKTTMYKLKARKHTFQGSELVDWLVTNEKEWVTDRETARHAAQVLLDQGVIRHVQSDFRVVIDGKHVYQWVEYDRKETPQSETFTQFVEHPESFMRLGNTFAESVKIFEQKGATCFYGSDGIDHLLKHLSISREEAVVLAQNLLEFGLFEELLTGGSLDSGSLDEAALDATHFKDSSTVVYKFRDRKEFTLKLLLLSEHTKQPGRAKAKQGFRPKYPVVLIPGLASSALEVWQSEEKKEWENERAWVDPLKIGTAAKLKSAKLRMKRVGKKLKKKAEQALSAEEENLRETLKREWTKHVMLQPDGFSDPPGIKLRAVEGIHGIDYLASGGIGRKATYVWSKVIEALRNVGYDVKNLLAAPYDWRLPPCKLEERDAYFTRLQGTVEQAVKLNKERVVLIGHSMGCRTTQYFLEFVRVREGQAWIDKHVHAFLALGPPFLGATKAFRGLLSGDPLGLDLFLVMTEARVLGRTFGSIPWLRPLQLDHLPDVMTRLRIDDSKDKDPKYEEVKDGRQLLEYSFAQAIDRWVNLYMNDPYMYNGYKFGADEPLPPILKPPPVQNLWAIYGINLPTEVSYYYKKVAEKELALDASADKFSNKKCPDNPQGLRIKGGMAFETPETEQHKHGVHRSGDGTVPYASLAYCKQWKEWEEKNGLNVEITEIEGAEHREMMANKVVINAILDYVCESPVCPVTGLREHH